MLSPTIVDALLMTCLVAVIHCASLSKVNLGRDAWLEDFEKIARQVQSGSSSSSTDLNFPACICRISRVAGQIHKI